MEIISALQALWSPVKDQCAFSCIVCKLAEYSFMKLIVGKDTRSQTLPHPLFIVLMFLKSCLFLSFVDCGIIQITSVGKENTTGLFFRDILSGFDGNIKCALWNSLVLGEQKWADEQCQARAWGQPLKSESQTYQEGIEILLILPEPQALDFNSWKLEVHLSLSELK